jgi:hypothetical protein
VQRNGRTFDWNIIKTESQIVQAQRKDDERLANEQEWQRLRADFEVRASQYPDLRFSVCYVIRDQPTADRKFSEPHHAINLWQYFGHATPGDWPTEFKTSELTPFEMTGAQVTAFAVIVGPETDLFRRMAERAGSLIPDEISHRIALEVASRFFENGTEGKPIYACNRNPLAKWLNLVLVAIATHQPDRFRTETLAVDPFTASLAAIDFLIGQNAASNSECRPAKGLLAVELQQLTHEVRSLAVNLHCCNQELAATPSASIMRRVHEQIQRIHALLPEPLTLANCDVLARRTLQELADWIKAIEPQLEDASPPFQLPELGLIYGFASELDRHADSDARRKSVARPFTELQRQQLQQKYGTTEYLRRRYAGETDNAVKRINAGITEALHRFPDMRCWTADDWSWLFFSAPDIVCQTAAWQSIGAGPLENLACRESQLMAPESHEPQPPKVFISYSWDDNEHKVWTKALAARLRGHGIDVTLDQWAVVPGDQLPRFMETAIRENSYVVIVCTPNYNLKSDQRKGGVGYEGDIMTAEVLTERNDRKFIAVLRSGTWDTAMPSWLKGKYSLDLSDEPYSEEQYSDLLVTLHNRREQAPPIGKAPHFSRSARKPRHSIPTRKRPTRHSSRSKSKEFSPTTLAAQPTTVRQGAPCIRFHLS